MIGGGGSAGACSPTGGARTRPGADVASDAAIDDRFRAAAETIHHPVGTCAMGPDNDRNAVVDASLRVRGRALRVVDAPVMPRLGGGNTDAPTIMIAERAADLIRGKAAA